MRDPKEMGDTSLLLEASELFLALRHASHLRHIWGVLSDEEIKQALADLNAEIERRGL